MATTKPKPQITEASAASNDIEDMRVQLTEGARAAFYDYYLADRASAVNEEGLRLLREMQKEAQTRYQNGLTPQQDIFQADVEIGRQNERKVILERMRTVASSARCRRAARSLSRP